MTPRRLLRWGWRDWAQILAVVIGAALLGYLLYTGQVRQDQVAALAEALEAEQDAARDRGETPVAPPPDDIVDDPAVPAPPVETPVPPTDEQVREAVEEYFEEHPPAAGRPPSPAEIAAAVVNYLTEHPPAAGPPGPPPSAEQIADAVADYLAAHPPAAGPTGPAGPPGEDGVDGVDGRPPTAEEIAAAVEDWLTEHPLPLCGEGTEARAITVLTTEGPVEIVACVVI